MARHPSPLAQRFRTLPAQPSLEHLKNEAKQRLRALRELHPQTKLTAAQLALAREYGFASWRQLKAHVDTISGGRLDRKRIFAAAREGDVETVRRAFEAASSPAQRTMTGAPFTGSLRRSGSRRSSCSPATSKAARPTRPMSGKPSTPSWTRP